MRGLLSEEASSALEKKSTRTKKNLKQMDLENEVIEQGSDGIKQIQKSLEVDIINSVLFEDYHRTLLPLVYMNQARIRLE